jgi:excisionase family DNA binding protein
MTLNLLTTDQAAKRLGVKRQWIAKLVSAGRLKAITVGGTYLIDPKELRKLKRRKYERK